MDQPATADPGPGGVYDGEPITGDATEHVRRVADELGDDNTSDDNPDNDSSDDPSDAESCPPRTPPHS